MAPETASNCLPSPETPLLTASLRSQHPFRSAKLISLLIKKSHLPLASGDFFFFLKRFMTTRRKGEKKKKKKIKNKK